MNEIIKEDNKIENLIYEIRGKQVMLDSDLAKLYQCKNGTKTINLAVKRHIKRFPERFMFRLTKEEVDYLRFQFETTSNMSRSLPYVFTEQGVAMLATVLRTEVAEDVSIAIMDAFVIMRKYISNDLLELKYMKRQVLNNSINIDKNTEDIKVLQESFSKFEKESKSNEIYFNGQIYDAYSKIQEIFNETTKRLIIIDGYADNTVLDIVKRIDKEVVIITKPNNLITEQDIRKYKEQYNNLTVHYDKTFHDRYYIIDEEEIYHCGASINRIGYKTFSITKIGDEEVRKLLIERVKEIISEEM